MDRHLILERFPDPESSVRFMEQARWNGHPVCPYCDVSSSSPMPRERRHHCNNCGTSFSVTTRTIFHKTKVDLRLWLLALLIVTEPRRKTSTRDLAGLLGVNRNTAAFMIVRVQAALLARDPYVQQLLRSLTEEEQ